MQYLYEGDKPDAASQIGSESYTYDLNGNPTLIEGDTTYREMVWNEENRLMILSDADYVSRYTYDYTGNRVIKSHGPMTTIYINGVLQGVDMHDDENYTLYVSPYMTVNADRFTKYYYAGTQRIASKLGSGKFDNVYGVNGFHLTAGGKDYAERSVQMVKGVQDYYKQAGVTPGVPNQQGQHANPYISGVAYPSVPLGDYSVPKGWPGALDRRQRGDVFGPPVNFLREAPQEAKAGVGFKSDHQHEDNLFYFHSDHLGSTSYLTDTAGNVSQFVWYAPYGESLVDEHTTTYENPFKFSGKELDDITGLYDHGARNRNPITAVWYGIDELFEKYPENGPYGYCGGNPVKLVDLDGRKIVFADDASEEFKQNFILAYNYLKEHNASFVIDELNNRNEIIILKETENSSLYRPSEKTIYWNPYLGLETTSNKRLSPASILSHESDHANHDCDNPEKHRLDSKKGTDSDYGKKEERRVITGSEQIVSLRLGEIMNGEVTRDNHNGYPFVTDSPISTKGEADIDVLDLDITVHSNK